MSNTIAVGDPVSDLCKITNTGMGARFSATGAALPITAGNTMPTDDLLTVPRYAQENQAVTQTTE